MSMHSPNPEGTLSWHGRLESAASEFEVLDVARDFIATVTPYEIARLPEPLRPPKITDASDVSAYAFDLIRSEISHLDNARVLHRLAHFFSAASTRLAVVLSRSRMPPPQMGRGVYGHDSAD